MSYYDDEPWTVREARRKREAVIFFVLLMLGLAALSGWVTYFWLEADQRDREALLANPCTYISEERLSAYEAELQRRECEARDRAFLMKQR